MAYALYTNHPETFDRREADFTDWRFWAEKNAPWTGVGIDVMAEILTAVCGTDLTGLVCQTLDLGGDLDAAATRAVLRAAEAVLDDETKDVLQRAADSGYGVRVAFTQSIGSALSASAYAAKFGSAAEH